MAYYTLAMRRASSGPVRIAAIVVLFVLVAVALPLRAGQPRHLHQATSAGLYNEEHVLASLEFVGGGVPLPDGPPSGLVALVVFPCPAGPAERHADPVASLADSRAPPRPA